MVVEIAAAVEAVMAVEIAVVEVVRVTYLEAFFRGLSDEEVEAC